MKYKISEVIILVLLSIVICKRSSEASRRDAVCMIYTSLQLPYGNSFNIILSNFGDYKRLILALVVYLVVMLTLHVNLLSPSFLA